MAAPSLIKPSTHAPGSSDLWGSCQANGQPILQIGDMAAYADPSGVDSPAETGIRLVDKVTGDIIFDTSGITSQAVIPQNAGGTVVVGPVAFTGTAWTSSGAYAGLTLKRQGSIIAWANVIAAITAGAGSGQIGLALDGTTPGTNQIYPFWSSTFTGSAYSNGFCFCLFTGVAPGAHKIYLVGQSSSGTVTLTIESPQVLLMQFGL